MMSVLNPRCSAIGVAVSPRAIEAVQLDLHGPRNPRPTVRDAVTLARLAPGEVFADAEALRLAAVLRRRRFHGRDVVLALPNARLVRGLIEVPGSSADPVQAAAQDAERTYGLAPGSYELAAWQPPPGSSPRPGRQAMVCISGYRHADAATWLDAFDAAGLSVNALDTRACAISRVLPVGENNDRSITALLDVDASAAELILLQRGTVVYQRPLLDSGLNRLDAELATVGLDDAAAAVFLRDAGYSAAAEAGGARAVLDRYVRTLVKEFEPAQAYVTRVYPDWPIERLAVVGEGAAVRGFEAAIRKALQLNDPVLLTSDEAKRPHARQLAVAFGMALYPKGAACAAA